MISGNRGYSLLEVLVSLIVLAVGLLGLVALQQVSVANSQGSHHHTLATSLAYDALERVRLELSDAAATGSVPSSILSSVASHYESTRYSSRFPSNFGLQLTGIGGQITVTVSWDDDRLGNEDEEGEAGAARTNSVQVRSRML